VENASTLGDKRGAIPKELAPILDRLAIDDRMWVASVRNFGRWFHRAAGRAEHLMEAAQCQFSCAPVAPQSGRIRSIHATNVDFLVQNT